MPHRNLPYREEEPSLISLLRPQVVHWAVSIASAAFLAGGAYTVLSLRQDNAEARIGKIETSREKTLDEWRQDQRESAAFQSKVLEKLDRIEKKIGQ